MLKNSKSCFTSFWALIGLIWTLSIFSCSSNSTTIRIKTDKSRSVRDLSSVAESEKPLDQGTLSIETSPKQTKEQMLAGQVNQLLNHYVKAEELMAEGKLTEAEGQLLLASAIVESRDGLLALLKIYEQTGNQVKADSCRKRLATLSPVILP